MPSLIVRNLIHNAAEELIVPLSKLFPDLFYDTKNTEGKNQTCL